jgi:hypothetical protein
MTSMSSQPSAVPHETGQPAAPLALPVRVHEAQEPACPVGQWTGPDLKLLRRVHVALKRL